MLPSIEPSLLYFFQHVLLRDAVFRNHPELIQDLYRNSGHRPFRRFWEGACLEWAMADPTGEATLDFENGFRAQDVLFEAIEVHRFRQAGQTAHVVLMPTPKESGDAYFVGIVHRDEEAHDFLLPSPNTHYFTLERSETTEPYFCEWRPPDSHLNYGKGVAPRTKAFAEALFQRVADTGS